jgi:hypothetical protein
MSLLFLQCVAKEGHRHRFGLTEQPDSLAAIAPAIWARKTLSSALSLLGTSAALAFSAASAFE